MKALLICPTERSNTAHLAEPGPLVNLVVYGKSLLEHWIDSLALKGAKEILVLAADRPEEVRVVVGDGIRWGLKLEVIPESEELDCVQAAAKYGMAADQIFLVETMPGQPGMPLFLNYQSLFQAVQSWAGNAMQGPRIGLREFQPGVWVGLHTQIAAGASLVAPCWIGDSVHIGPETVIGPNACVENNVVIEKGVEIHNCLVGCNTFVGAGTYLEDSIILGNILINYRLNSFIKIRDSFLLSSMSRAGRRRNSQSLIGRMAAAVVLFFSFPLVIPFIVRCYWKGTRAFKEHRCARPLRDAESSGGGSSVVYYELNYLSGWGRRWPQLWNVVRGEFSWIGNRPLTSLEASKLYDDFERLWLAVPTGLIAHSDAEGCSDYFSDEGKAHASFYAARAGWKLDLAILIKAFKRAFVKGSKSKAIHETDLKQKSFNIGRTAMSGFISKIF